jgi:hypothetical protein
MCDASARSAPDGTFSFRRRPFLGIHGYTPSATATCSASIASVAASAAAPTQRLDCAQLVYRHLLCGAWQVTPTGAVGAVGLRLSNEPATVLGEAPLNAAGRRQRRRSARGRFQV